LKAIASIRINHSKDKRTIEFKTWRIKEKIDKENPP
jgi:hypothetical protein